MILALLGLAHAGCDRRALEALAASLPSDAGPALVAPALAKACPRPVAWVRALEGWEDPVADQAAATAQITTWTEACEGGLAALPSGWDAVGPGERLTLWQRCGLDGLGLFDADAWSVAKGPAVTTILAARVLERDGLALEPRRRLVRALAGIPVDLPPLPSGVTTLGAPDPVGEFEGESPPAAVLLADVPWPPNTDPSAVCTVRAAIIQDGTPASIEWVSCPEDLRYFVEHAMNASWFRAGTKDGQPVRAVVQLSFTPRR